ncbi:unnamed protein product [Rhizoctonia solani]|uniref:NADH:flavin oxidoreductase/NADH oxidase N-terminal domain-containing protein n=1 Tax=Rhizoctonia solani TaxID=456999 RepID=A0A8H3GFM3_9AGAM|nr:unnamed protein product [Rhizoctonia solani]
MSSEAAGYPNFPGFFTDAQVAGWRKVVDAVHTNGSYIHLQIVSFGRLAHPEVLRAAGHPYVYSSPAYHPEHDEIPLELSQADIRGSLIDPFVQDSVNKRTDGYGGSIHNRSRFVLEIVEAVVEKIGVKRTGVRFSPWSQSQGHGNAQSSPDIQLHKPGINADGNGTTQALDEGVKPSNDFAYQVWSPRTYITGGGYDHKSALQTADKLL